MASRNMAPLVAPPSDNINNMSYAQVAGVMNAIAKQATGVNTLTPANTSEFVSVAQTALKSGYDPVMDAISQVLTRTIFSIRPYYAKLRGVKKSSQKFGNHLRKLQISDREFEHSQTVPLEDDTSVDMYKIKKPKVTQTNFYGHVICQDHCTIFTHQLDVAFTTPDEFQRFMAMVAQNISDRIEQLNENTARYTLGNYMGGIIAGNNALQVRHLVSEYNEFAGTALTPETVRQPDNYEHFIQWAFSTLNTTSELLTERTVRYHTNIGDKLFARHTPQSLQKVYLYAPEINMINTMVRSSLYNESFLKLADYESLNFWQSIDKPGELDLNVIYMDGTGALQTADVKQKNILGIIFDYESIGYTTVGNRMHRTPLNAAGEYYNLYYHFDHRYYNDFTENGIVLLMD